MPLRAGRNRAFARRRRGYPDGVALEGLHHITAITADAPRNVDEPRCEQLERRLTPISDPRRPA